MLDVRRCAVHRGHGTGDATDAAGYAAMKVLTYNI